MSTVLLLCSLISILNGQSLLDLILFPPNTNGGQCQDGSPAGFYYQKPQYGDSNLWVIQIQGGGGCHDKAKCDQRANSKLGSSKKWANNMTATGILSSNPLRNPDFYKGHKVFGAYCSSDVWSGQRTTPSSNPDTWGYYFSGHLVFKSIIKYMAQHLNFLNASHILLTGGSAGGIGTLSNADWLKNELAQNAINKSVVFKAAPIAGWFFPSNTSDQLNDPLMPPNDYPNWVQHTNGGSGHNSSAQMLWDSYLNPVCVEALSKNNNSWHCGCVGNGYKYIQTPLFILQNKFDTSQIESSFMLPPPSKQVNNETIGYVEYYGIDADRSILTQMVDSGQTKNGLFYPSCFDHGDGLGIGTGAFTIIDGYNSSELVGDWFWERNKLPHIVYDKCNSQSNQLPCNPTCDGYPK